MKNVTDTLLMVLDHLGELQHDLDALSDKITGATELRHDTYLPMIQAFSQVAGTMAWLRQHAEDELRIIDRESSLLRTQRCCECGESFVRVVVPGRPKVYCSSRCRQRTYRARAAQHTE